VLDAAAIMTSLRRTQASVVGDRESAAIAASLGRDLRDTRRKRRLTQQALGALVGMSHARVGELERGHGSGAPIETWVALGIALGRPIAISFSRDIEVPMPADAGHLAGQEILLRQARAHGRRAQFELATRPADPSASIDACCRDDGHQALIVEEIWNRIGDLGAVVRTTTRKIAEAQSLAVLAGGDGPAYRVAHCWILLDTAANRRLVKAYPEVLRARFPGSSLRWVEALRDGAAPPVEPGILWLDPRSGLMTPLRWRDQPPPASKASIVAR
jgi:transcriptional regulator with XRE-family HTH domain